MAFVSKDLKAKIAAKLKTIMDGKGFRYSLAVRHHSTIVLTIQSGPIDFIGEYNAAKADTRNAYGDEFKPVADDMRLNQWDLRGDVFTGDTLALLDRLWQALHTDHFDKSDSQTDYFHVSHYVDLSIGRWDKPYVLTMPAPPPHGIDRAIQEQAAYYGTSAADQARNSHAMADAQERADALQWEA